VKNSDCRESYLSFSSKLERVFPINLFFHKLTSAGMLMHIIFESALVNLVMILFAAIV